MDNEKISFLRAIFWLPNVVQNLGSTQRLIGLKPMVCTASETLKPSIHNAIHILSTRDVFYVRRKVDLMNTVKVNAYIMHIFGKIEL